MFIKKQLQIHIVSKNAIIVVINNIYKRIDPIFSIENHIEEVEAITAWESFFNAISIVDMI